MALPVAGLLITIGSDVPWVGAVGLVLTAFRERGAHCNAERS
ncbi:MAG: hypothetical protein ACO1OB_28615 [Archangium sp.]